MSNQPDEFSFDLVRSSLLARLAVQLDDLALGRRAALQAGRQAQQLAALDIRAVDGAAVLPPGAALEELYALAYPSTARWSDSEDRREDDSDNEETAR